MGGYFLLKSRSKHKPTLPTAGVSLRKGLDHRSVMPSDVLGDTRATIGGVRGSWSERAGGTGEPLVLWIGLWKGPMKAECLVILIQQIGMNASLDFVLTARR